MTILVTGGAGFIGFHCCRKLVERGDDVLAIDNLNSYYPPALKRDRLRELEGIGSFRFSQVDFGERSALDEAVAGLKIDKILHLGAQAGVRYSIENPYAYAHSNLVGHLNMLELARDRAVDHFVYASSSSVYGASPRVPFRVEDRVDHPMSFYAATKKSNELMSETYSHLYRIPQTGLRFFTVYGPWGRPDMAMWIFTSRILNGEPIPVFNDGNMRRDFTFITDIVSGVVKALDNPPEDDGLAKPGGSQSPHRLYNIGNHRAERLDRLIKVIESACGRSAIRDYKPMQPGDVPATFADISAIERDLGFRPTTSIDEGVPQFVDWYRHYHQLQLVA